MFDIVNISDSSSCPELEEVISLLSRITSIAHEFETCVSLRNGGPVRYVVQIGKRQFLAWLDEVDSIVVVTPIELVDAGMWIDEKEKNEPILVLLFVNIRNLVSVDVHLSGRITGFLSSMLPMEQA